MLQRARTYAALTSPVVLPLDYGDTTEGGPVLRYEDQGIVKSLSNYYFLIFPLVEKGTIFSLINTVIKRGNQLSQKTVLYLIKQLCQRIKELQVAGISHLDIKPDNVVLMNDFTVKLIDMGHAALANTAITHRVNTTNFVAPEVYPLHIGDQAPAFLTNSVDIFGIGVFLFVLQFRRYPFELTNEKPHYQPKGYYK